MGRTAKKGVLKPRLVLATRLEFDLLSQEGGWWEGKLDEVRAGGMIGLEGGRWTHEGVMGWLGRNPDRRAEFDGARRDYADKIALECLPISDTAEGDVARDKLKIDTRFKLAGKWDRDRYGEHVKVEKTTTVVDDGLLLAGMVELLRLASTPVLHAEHVIEAEVVNDR